MRDLDQEKIRFEGFIVQINRLKKDTIELLFSVRKDIDSLNKLKPQFPDSKLIVARFAENEQLLGRASNILIEIDTQLSMYREKIQTINKAIETREADNRVGCSP
jgi:hypothetical protein